ncbi:MULTISPECIES: hypothetical protein [Acinetobacter]|uniref:Uncharacterized protein n=1 Tax=Acinetobacter indicus TaxID=756892 RepID=A0A6C0Y7L1_9GAMM|nr:MULTISPECIES: hypothetical protein [Acinetobacter]QIC71862.1 hypothetical protein FSC09_15850 [Acinetobacter indicus]QKQ71398.1 hypothetical protein E5Y90_14300 [Acinetobacter sp. 10FS3-1]
MFSLSTHHSDDCTYSYENLLAVIPNFSPENINKLADFIKENYELSEDQLLELLDYQNYAYNGVVLKDLKGYTYRLIIQTVKCIGA